MFNIINNMINRTERATQSALKAAKNHINNSDLYKLK